MGNKLQIQLFGGFEVLLDGQPVQAFRAAKARALLAFLAIEADRFHSRTSLATLLWGELADTAARTNLRITLSNLKQVLAAHPALEIRRGDVCLHSTLAHAQPPDAQQAEHQTDVQSDVLIDVVEFRQGLTAFAALPVESQKGALSRLVALCDLYRGEFLAGMQIDDATEFEDWQLITREQLHEELMHALQTVQTGFAEQGRWRELADAARRQLALVPWAESAHRNIMQALAAQNRIQDALNQFDVCRRVLQEELGMEPSLPTLELAARLRGEKPAPASTQHNLPPQLKTFVGRAQEISQLPGLVKTRQLVTILGIGGVGKSHLAQTTAQHALTDFADGVWFISLANIQPGESAPDRIALAIAAIIGFPIADAKAPRQELTGYLHDKQMLLVLDNWDHLVDFAPTVLEPLLHSTPVHVLATSRVRLMLEGEHVLPLQGLPQSEAVTLFIERARRVVPTFAADMPPASEDELVHAIHAVCKQVAGLPLGIELAASWVEHYAVAEIGESLTQIEIAPQQRASLVHRHHQLSSVFEYSWQLLGPRQQEILARLAVFRGGFDRAAATAVAECGLSELSSLISHSLVQRLAAGRYDLHPLIQEFAADKLAPEAASTARERHSRHYLSTLVATAPNQRSTRLADDFDNLRSGWLHAVQTGNHTDIEEAAVAYGAFVAQVGLLTDGETLFQSAVARFEHDARHNELVAQLLEQQRRFSRMLWGMAIERAIAERVLTLSNDVDLRVKAHSDLGNYYSERGNWELADHHFDAMEAQASQSSDLKSYVLAVESRIHINALHFRGDLRQGILRLLELVDMLEQTPESQSDLEETRSQVLHSLCLVAMRYGNYALAIRCAEQNLADARTIGDQLEACWVLLDLALVEQFAGLYEAAIAHNFESLALAEEMQADSEFGLLQANLCLTLRQAGELEQALRYGLAAIPLLQDLHVPRQEGQARNRVGHVYLALEQWDAAYAAYQAALEVWAPQAHPNRYEAAAGCAVAAWHLGQAEEALALVQEVLDFVGDAERLTGMVEPVGMLLNCATVLAACARAEEARRVLEKADAWRQTIAGRIGDDAVRAAYLQRPDNQRLVQRLAAHRQPQS